jgi:hypothetical protein
MKKILVPAVLMMVLAGLGSQKANAGSFSIGISIGDSHRHHSPPVVVAPPPVVVARPPVVYAPAPCAPAPVVVVRPGYGYGHYHGGYAVRTCSFNHRHDRGCDYGRGGYGGRDYGHDRGHDRGHGHGHRR